MQSYPIQAIYVTTSKHVPTQHKTKQNNTAQHNTYLLHNNSACFTITSQVLLSALCSIWLFISLLSIFFPVDANVTWFISVKSGNAVANELFHVLHTNANTHTCAGAHILAVSVSPFRIFNFNVTASHSQPNEMCCEMKTHCQRPFHETIR